jgi:hypothetical protein
MKLGLLRVFVIASLALCLHGQSLNVPNGVATYPTLTGDSVRSYFKVTLHDMLLSSSTLQNGAYKGWCADQFSWANSGSLHWLYPAYAQFSTEFRDR